MAPAKLNISPRYGARFAAFDVMFNPNAYSISKSVNWTSAMRSAASQAEGGGTDRTANAPATSFGGGGSRQLSLELFFDTTERPRALQDVRLETDKLVALTLMERTGEESSRPPVCAVQWGDKQTADFPFIGTVSSLQQRFVLFRGDGVPLRATLNVSFVEFLERELDQRRTDPEMTTRTVRRGDTLSGIAADVYRDPGLWRAIAEANDIDDPLRLDAGRALVIPKLEKRRNGTRQPQ
jgi:nucleoid-associated protein YgaU